MTSGPFFLSNTVFAIIIIAPFKTALSEKAFLFFSKCAALNETSVAFCEFFKGLMKKDLCLPKAAFNLWAIAARMHSQVVKMMFS